MASNRKRQVWWACNGHNHFGCVRANVYLSRAEATRLEKAILRKHRADHPLCFANTITVAAKRHQLAGDVGILRFSFGRESSLIATPGTGLFRRAAQALGLV